MEFFDDDSAPTSASGGSSSRRRQRPTRRTPRQQIALRRGLALAGGLLILILLVLGVRGCLNARADRALADYSRDVSQIVDETQRTSTNLFKRLGDPGALSVQDFQTEVRADRGAVDGYLARVQALNAPGDMSAAQNALELVYELRDNAMNEISAQLPKALGDQGREDAITAIATEMQTLLAADVDYAAIVKPEIDGVLADNGITDSDVPDSIFLPDGTKWLDETTITAALDQVSGAAAPTAGSHGTGIAAVSVDGSTLEENVPSTVAASTAPTVEVQVQDQGDAEESGVTVSVSVDGGTPLTGTIDTIAPGATETASITLTPAPKGQVTLDVEVQPVPGEQVTENNKASYTVTFQ